MDLDTAHIQLQYLGFLNTSSLWNKDPVFGLQQLQLTPQKTAVFNAKIPKNLRLGKRVERFVSHQLQESDATSVIIENIQVQQHKRTIGELDCLLMLNNTPIHLEIVYKFYLYDNRIGTSELDHWIGPNRNDSLIQKLTKLKDKQLPLLYAPETKPILKGLNLRTKEIQQLVCFKAQLFVPFTAKEISFELLNPNCVNGFYITYSELEQFSGCKFYIPTKVNWLMEIQILTDWINYELFLTKIKTLIVNKVSSLCWVKKPNGELHKCFVVWWH